MDELFTKAEPDRFQHESPTRAFTEWRVDGGIAVGKGFRPSLAHLGVYLDALASKEGWDLIQVLMSDRGGDPTMLFRRYRDDPDDMPSYFVENGDVRRIDFPMTAYDTGQVAIRIGYKNFQGQPCEAIYQPTALSNAFNSYPGLADMIAHAIEGEIEHGEYTLDDETGRMFFHNGEGKPKVTNWHGKLQTALEKLGLTMVAYGKEFRVFSADREDMVNHPKHYAEHPSGLECIVIKRHMSSDLGDAFKYVWRAGEKGPFEEDVQKAVWYLEDEIKRREGNPMIKMIDDGSYFRQAMIIDHVGTRFIEWCRTKAPTYRERMQQQALNEMFIAATKPTGVLALKRAIRCCNNMIDTRPSKHKAEDLEDDYED